MMDLVKVKGLKGKQNKKKWRKNIDVSALLEHAEQKHTEQIRKKFASTLTVEADTDLLRKPLDPNRFKSKGVPLLKPNYNNKLKKQNILAEDIHDPWMAEKPQVVKYKIPAIPAIVKPQTGHSYNPSQQGIKKIIDNIIDYEGQKQKKTKKIKKISFRQQQVRHRNKNVRNQQLQARQKKANNLLKYEVNSHKKLAKQIDDKMEEITNKINQKKQKKEKLEKEERTGKVRYGKKIGKLQYRYQQTLPNSDQIGKKLSHVGGVEELIKDRFESVYRRGIFEPRNIKVHANKTKNIKSKTKYRNDDQL